MKIRSYAQRTTIVCSVITMLAVAALAQAPQPAIGDTGSGSIPSEPGMYVQTAGGFNKILGQIVAFTRSGSLLVSKLTVGIKTTKQNVQLLGPHAQTVVDSKPMFCFIPPKQEAEAGVNAGDLVLVRLEEKTERRQFEIGAVGMARASQGISITHQIQLFRSEVKPGAYTITPAGALGKGEYALYLSRGEGMQAYVYDFSVDRRTDLTSQIAPSQSKPVAQDSSAAPVAVTPMVQAQPVTEQQEASYAVTRATQSVVQKAVVQPAVQQQAAPKVVQRAEKPRVCLEEMTYSNGDSVCTKYSEQH
jgi:hypothetical protein